MLLPQTGIEISFKKNKSLWDPTQNVTENQLEEYDIYVRNRIMWCGGCEMQLEMSVLEWQLC